jgi:hypothetical protein
MSVALRIKPRVAGVPPQETRLRLANEHKARCILTQALGSRSGKDDAGRRLAFDAAISAIEPILGKFGLERKAPRDFPIYIKDEESCSSRDLTRNIACNILLSNEGICPGYGCARGSLP